jgi:hypothetical protein
MMNNVLFAKKRLSVVVLCSFLMAVAGPHSAIGAVSGEARIPVSGEARIPVSGEAMPVVLDDNSQQKKQSSQAKNATWQGSQRFVGVKTGYGFARIKTTHSSLNVSDVEDALNWGLRLGAKTRDLRSYIELSTNGWNDMHTLSVSVNADFLHPLHEKSKLLFGVHLAYNWFKLDGAEPATAAGVGVQLALLYGEFAVSSAKISVELGARHGFTSASIGPVTVAGVTDSLGSVSLRSLSSLYCGVNFYF